MKRQTDAMSARQGSPERVLPTFPMALGHRLRRIREDKQETGASIADYSSFVGLNWDRSTVARVELGQRALSASELFALALMYERPVTDLLPDEACWLNGRIAVTPDALRQALVAAPEIRHGWTLPDLEAQVNAGLDQVEAEMKSLEPRFPGISAWRLAAAVDHRNDEATTKAATRLGVDRFDVAVCAEGLWERGLTEERERRLSERNDISTPRRRQGVRGHVTRALLEELRPVLEELQQDRQSKGGQG